MRKICSESATRALPAAVGRPVLAGMILYAAQTQAALICAPRIDSGECASDEVCVCRQRGPISVSDVKISAGATAVVAGEPVSIRSDFSVDPGSELRLVSSSPRAARLVQPEDFDYLGAFRLPGSEERPRTFAYGGNAMTFYPTGDPDGAADGFPGSLFVTGHDRMPYGDLPDGDQLAEVAIPAPVISSDLSQLPTASFLQDFTEVAAGEFPHLDEIPRLGIEYLDAGTEHKKLHLSWGAHFQDPPATDAPLAWLETSLATPSFQGTWYPGAQSLYNVSGYLFEIPVSWSDRYGHGRLANGRFRDGGWSGKGPSIVSYTPWLASPGVAASDGTAFEARALLLYEDVDLDEDVNHRALSGYQHPDEWEGGAWLTTTGGKEATLLAGTKSLGDKYWYGYIHPDGPQYPCVDVNHVGEFVVCRNADGTPCPATDLLGCASPPTWRGWWSTEWRARLILYDPLELAMVARGLEEPWEPQPYASVDIHDRMLLNPAGIERETIGFGPQRRFLIGAAAYDRSHDLLYVLELFADEAKPVVHVWHLR